MDFSALLVSLALPLGVALLAFGSLVWRRRRTDARYQAHIAALDHAELLSWARRGPFSNGRESARALRDATLESDQAGGLSKRQLDAICRAHARHYDRDPQRWLQSRARALRDAYAKRPSAPDPVSTTAATTLPWSDAPGGHEQHLARRWNNPLFPVDQRTITAEEIRRAQARDAARFAAFEHRFDTLIVDLLDHDPTDIEQLTDLKALLEDQITLALSHGARTQTQLETADAARALVISEIRQLYREEPGTLDLLGISVEDRRDVYRPQRLRPLHLHLLGTEPCVPRDDLVPTLASEPPDELVRLVCIIEEQDPVLGPDLRARVLDCLTAALEQGIDERQIRAKIDALALPRASAA
jgi:hypothetical protein